MDIEDLNEGTAFTEVKNDQQEKVLWKNDDLEDVLSEEIKIEAPVTTNEVNEDDFITDFSDSPGNAAVENKKDETKETAKEKRIVQPVSEEEKNKAATRLFRPEVVLQTYNAFTGRIGKVINKKNPDCLKFDNEDMSDIGILLKNTAEEEGWSSFPTKWLLIFLVAIILVGKIIMWNKPPAHLQQQQQQVQNIQAPAEQQQQQVAFKPDPGQEKIISELQENIQMLQQQNKLMQDIIDKKLEDRKSETSSPGAAPNRMYKNYDLEKISFTENGALIDISKIGQKGYSPLGKKYGIISHEMQDVHKQWKRYQLFKELQEEEVV